MSNIIPLSGGTLPAYLRDKTGRADINRDVVRAAEYPTMSLKGKVWAVVRDGQREKLVNSEGDPVSSITAVMLRANTKARNYYSKKYVEGESEGQRPACYSFDGVTPASDSDDIQAKKCALCPHAVWGTGRENTGTACAQNTRLVIAAPDKLDDPMLLRVPPASIKPHRDLVKALNARGVPYNAAVVKMTFDPDAATPKLVFKPVGLLDDASFAVADKMYEDKLVIEIAGVNPPEGPVKVEKSGAVDTDELDAALAAKAAAKAAEAEKAASEAAKATEAEKPRRQSRTKKEEAKAESDDDASGLLGDLDQLLGATDD